MRSAACRPRTSRSAPRSPPAGASSPRPSPACRRLEAVLSLGAISHQSVVRALGGRLAAQPFRHAAQSRLGHITLFSSYHCSRYNTNTGVLTECDVRERFQGDRGVSGFMILERRQPTARIQVFRTARRTSGSLLRHPCQIGVNKAGGVTNGRCDAYPVVRYTLPNRSGVFQDDHETAFSVERRRWPCRCFDRLLAGQRRCREGASKSPIPRRNGASC